MAHISLPVVTYMVDDIYFQEIDVCTIPA